MRAQHRGSMAHQLRGFILTSMIWYLFHLHLLKGDMFQHTKTLATWSFHFEQLHAVMKCQPKAKECKIKDFSEHLNC